MAIKTEEQKMAYLNRERYMVTESFPNMPYPVGCIILISEGNVYQTCLDGVTLKPITGILTKEVILECPAVFKKAHWSAGIRTLAEEWLPDYVMNKSGLMYKVSEHHNNCAADVEPYFSLDGINFSYCDFKPVTKEQYEAFVVYRLQNKEKLRREAMDNIFSDSLSNILFMSQMLKYELEIFRSMDIHKELAAGYKLQRVKNPPDMKAYAASYFQAIQTFFLKIQQMDYGTWKDVQKDIGKEKLHDLSLLLHECIELENIVDLKDFVIQFKNGEKWI